MNAASRRPTGRGYAGAIVIYALMLLASMHCVASIFFTNYSFLDLEAYRNGTERMPYQGRIGMMPVLRLADHSSAAHRAVDKLNRSLGTNHRKSPFQGMTTAKLACIAAAGAAMLAMVAAGILYGRRWHPELWWLPSTLLLGMYFVTQAARYETPLWYPYDLPHAALFGIASLFIIRGKWHWAFIFFLLDLPMRETALFLAGVTFTAAWGRNERRQGIMWAGAMAVIWVVFRAYIHHRFAANPDDTQINLHSIVRLGLDPVHWPQMFSAFGFLLIPLIWQNARLSRPQRMFLLGASPCIIVTLAFGLWMETRIFSEWLLAASALLTAEVTHFIQTPNHADTAQRANAASFASV